MPVVSLQNTAAATAGEKVFSPLLEALLFPEGEDTFTAFPELASLSAAPNTPISTHEEARQALSQQLERAPEHLFVDIISCIHSPLLKAQLFYFLNTTQSSQISNETAQIYLKNISNDLGIDSTLTPNTPEHIQAFNKKVADILIDRTNQQYSNYVNPAEQSRAALSYISSDNLLPLLSSLGLSTMFRCIYDVLLPDTERDHLLNESLAYVIPNFAKSGDLNMLRWLVKKLDQYTFNHAIIDDEYDTFFQAISSGELDVIEWVFNQLNYLQKLGALDEHGTNAYRWAVENRNKDVAIWVHEKLRAMPSDNTSPLKEYDIAGLEVAAQMNEPEIYEWVFNNIDLRTFNDSALLIRIGKCASSNLEFFKWIYENGKLDGFARDAILFGGNYSLFQYAAEEPSRKQIFEWLYDQYNKSQKQGALTANESYALIKMLQFALDERDTNTIKFFCREMFTLLGPDVATNILNRLQPTHEVRKTLGEEMLTLSREIEIKLKNLIVDYNNHPRPLGDDKIAQFKMRAYEILQENRVGNNDYVGMTFIAGLLDAENESFSQAAYQELGGGSLSTHLYKLLDRQVLNAFSETGDLQEIDSNIRELKGRISGRSSQSPKP